MDYHILEEIFVLNSQFESTFDGMRIEIVLLAELGNFPSSDFSRSFSNWTFVCLNDWIDEKIAKTEICEGISSFILMMMVERRRREKRVEMEMEMGMGIGMTFR